MKVMLTRPVLAADEFPVTNLQCMLLADQAGLQVMCLG